MLFYHDQYVIEENIFLYFIWTSFIKHEHGTVLYKILFLSTVYLMI